MELGFEQHQPSTIWTDSASAQLLATTFQLSSKSQHLTMRINAIHQEVVNKVIVIKWIDTEGNTVDVLNAILVHYIMASAIVLSKQKLRKLTGQSLLKRS